MYVEWLLAVFDGVVETTVAVLSNDPDEFGLVTTTVNVAEPVTAARGVVKLQVTMPRAAAHGDVAETNVVPAGRMSVTVTLFAGLGPVFVTTMV